jgi:excisionase family DNA binding protein
MKHRFPFSSSEAEKNQPSMLGEMLRKEIKSIVKEAVVEVLHGRQENEDPRQLLTAAELAKRLKVPVSWVYERSRQNRIPTRRVGRYVRFQLPEVLNSIKAVANPTC